MFERIKPPNQLGIVKSDLNIPLNLVEQYNQLPSVDQKTIDEMMPNLYKDDLSELEATLPDRDDRQTPTLATIPMLAVYPKGSQLNNLKSAHIFANYQVDSIVYQILRTDKGLQQVPKYRIK